MSEVNADFIERYQLVYEKDPSSKVFAPLAEAYRRMGLLEEAFRIASAGVKIHPNFPSGRVALAKIQIERSDMTSAAEHLRVAVELSPENILAHTLLAETYLKLKDPKNALRSYKMVLFMNPADVRAQKFVQKLESLTADEFEDTLFKIEGRGSQTNEPAEVASPLRPLKPRNVPEILYRQRLLERLLSLSDAYIVRNDIDRAAQTIEEAENQIGPHPELEKRKALVRERRAPISTPMVSRTSETSPVKLRASLDHDRKVMTLKTLMHRIATRRAQPRQRSSTLSTD
jgi:tetratricopeptide (TPR) repeat protein